MYSVGVDALFSTGPVLSSALTGAFTFCAALLAGAVLAIVYFSPAADWFQKKELTHMPNKSRGAQRLFVGCAVPLRGSSRSYVRGFSLTSEVIVNGFFAGVIFNGIYKEAFCHSSTLFRTRSIHA